MNTIFTYLETYKNVSFLEKDFNEVDNLIFCAFSYIDFSGIIQKENTISIKELYTKYKFLMDEKNIFKKDQNDLFQLLSESKRFQDILITGYVNDISKEEEKQFGAITFILPNEQLFVAFKGTDETITGWKEDFNMSYMSVIPSQKSAKEYLEEILKNTKKSVLVGGHSKGGNLAMYAAIFCPEELKNKISKVYNNDGPGFAYKIDLTKEYQTIKDKIITYIPKSSIVGNIFDSYTKIIIIESTALGILQHNLYSWLILEDTFLYVKEMDGKTKELANRLNAIIYKIPNKEKKRIVTVLYDIISSFSIYNLEKTMQDLFHKYHLTYEDIEWLRKILPFAINLLKEIFS